MIFSTTINVVPYRGTDLSLLSTHLRTSFTLLILSFVPSASFLVMIMTELCLVSMLSFNHTPSVDGERLKHFLSLVIKALCRIFLNCCFTFMG